MKHRIGSVLVLLVVLSLTFAFAHDGKDGKAACEKKPGCCEAKALGTASAASLPANHPKVDGMTCEEHVAKNVKNAEHCTAAEKASCEMASATKASVKKASMKMDCCKTDKAKGVKAEAKADDQISSDAKGTR